MFRESKTHHLTITPHQKPPCRKRGQSNDKTKRIHHYIITIHPLDSLLCSPPLHTIARASLQFTDKIPFTFTVLYAQSSAVFVHPSHQNIQLQHPQNIMPCYLLLPLNFAPSRLDTNNCPHNFHSAIPSGPSQLQH